MMPGSDHDVLDVRAWASTIRERAAAVGVRFDEAAALLMARHLREVFADNARVGLTNIEDPDEAIDKHIIDSLTVARIGRWSPEVVIGDVGSGAGYPGIPLYVALGAGRLVLIEAQRRKAEFLSRVAAELGIRDVEVQWRRAEEAGRDAGMREGMDVVVSRAVAELPVLLELCLPLVKVGGRFVAMKGPGMTAELARSERALAVLGGKVGAVVDLTLPGGRGARRLLVIEKVGHAEERYPRRPGVPEKRPL